MRRSTMFGLAAAGAIAVAVGVFSPPASAQGYGRYGPGMMEDYGYRGMHRYGYGHHMMWDDWGYGDARQRCADEFRSFHWDSGQYTTRRGEKRLCPYLR